MSVDLEARIRRRLAIVEGCSHQMCSMTDEAAEHHEAVSLRKLLCEHARWKRFDGQRWNIAPFVQDDPCGCYCDDCGARSSELLADELAAALASQEKPA